MTGREIQGGGYSCGRPHGDLSDDAYRKSILFGLIEERYLYSGTLTQFAADVLAVIACAVTVPVAFTEGFLRAYLSIERIDETVDGRLKIIPKQGASMAAIIHDADEITARVDPGSVFNPVVRKRLDLVREPSREAVVQDIKQLPRLADDELMDALRALQRVAQRRAGAADAGAASTDYVRVRLDAIRRNVRQYQAGKSGSAPSLRATPSLATALSPRAASSPRTAPSPRTARWLPVVPSPAGDQ